MFVSVAFLQQNTLSGIRTGVPNMRPNKYRRRDKGKHRVYMYGFMSKDGQGSWKREARRRTRRKLNEYTRQGKYDNIFDRMRYLIADIWDFY